MKATDREKEDGNNFLAGGVGACAGGSRDTHGLFRQNKGVEGGGQREEARNREDGKRSEKGARNERGASHGVYGERRLEVG